MRMKFQIVSLVEMNENQIKGLARLHQRAMHSLLNDLGLPFIERYYQLARADSSAIGLCALGADASLLGWAVGSPQPEQIARRMSEAWGWFVVQLARVLFTNPNLILQMLISSRSSSTAMKEGAVELTYIGVDESARKQGVGRALLQAFIEAAREKNFSTVELSVEAENAGAIALYTKAGFEITRSFREGKFDRHRMELKIQ